MIKVTLGSNCERKQVVVPETTTVKEVFQNNNVDYMTGAIFLDGAPITGGQMNMTLAELHVSDSCYLIVTVKSDGAR